MDKGLRNLARTYFPKAKLSDLSGNVTFVTVNYRDQKIQYFNNKEAQSSADKDVWIEDLLCGATAAPGYFPSVVCDSVSGVNQFRISDGGVMANSPLCKAYTQAKIASPDKSKLVISLETGSAPLCITDEQARNWGLLHHLRPLIYSLLRGNHDYQDDCIDPLIRLECGNDRYFRAHPDLPPHLDQIDDISPEFFQGMREILEAYSKSEGFRRLLDQLRPLAEARRDRCLNVAPRR